MGVLRVVVGEIDPKLFVAKAAVEEKKLQNGDSVEDHRHLDIRNEDGEFDKKRLLLRTHASCHLLYTDIFTQVHSKQK